MRAKGDLLDRLQDGLAGRLGDLSRETLSVVHNALDRLPRAADIRVLASEVRGTVESALKKGFSKLP